MTHELKAELELALSLAREAGPIALRISRGEFAVDHKSRDDSPVTEADRRVNELIVSAIQAHFPEDTIVAEESPNPRPGQAERCWFIDPIDGTRDFVQRNGEWSIMIGFALHGRPVLGVVHQPQEERLYWGVPGQGAWLEERGTLREISAGQGVDPEGLVVARSRNHPDPRIARILKHLGVSRDYTHGSVGLKVAHLAEGRADLYFNFSGKCGMWDVCAADALLSAAGGAIYDFEGEAVRYRGESPGVRSAFIASSTAMKPAILSALRAHPELNPETEP